MLPISHRHKKRINEIAPCKAWVLVSVPTKTDNLPHVLHGALFFDIMKQIPLTQGKFALVDDDEFEILNQFKWCAIKQGKQFYAVRKGCVGGKQKIIRMHREILGLSDPKVFCDHKNNNGLDNQRVNLRSCSNTENIRNTGKKANNASGFKGVCFREDTSKFRAQIWVSGKPKHLGYFTCPIEAARAYDTAATMHHGKFANLNFSQNN